MKITVIGTGYVGLVTGACLSDLGHEVICLDIDEEKIKKLNEGIIPIYEPGLKEIVDRNFIGKRLFFTTNTKNAIQSSEIIFIAVGTPSSMNGDADLKYVLDVAKNIGKHINSYKIIVNKSTVPVGTASKVKKTIKDNLNEKFEFDVVSNPEFLKEGMAIRDFSAPDRIVIGVDSLKAKELMSNVYKDIERSTRPIVFTDIKSAELTKYASNAMLATRISFMNQLSCLCDKVGADIKEVARGMGLDSRIGSRFLQAGVGYGGSCFPKDVLALTSTLKENNCPNELFESVHLINQRQKILIVDKLLNHIDVKDKIISLWGISFKPKTDDIRDAPSIEVIIKLLDLGANLKVFDPIAMNNSKKLLKETLDENLFKKIEFSTSEIDAIKDSSALLLLTEWDIFRNPDFNLIKKNMKNHLIIDGRNIYESKELNEMGFTYEGIGRK
ncbi:MAG: UDP-glucose dehydrogenase family protein [Nanoarchaeota archaeon]